MITLTLDWREVLWWMQGGMAGSHLRWSVYEDMVNKVWPQCSEQERRNIWLIMRRDLGSYWRPDGWPGHKLMWEKGEGAWKADDEGHAIGCTDPDGNPFKAITDLTPWMYFRQVLARFDPDNQFAVTMKVKNSAIGMTPEASIIWKYHSYARRVNPGTLKKIIVRAYRWQDEYRIDWSRRCAEDGIVNIEKLEIPDTGVM